MALNGRFRSAVVIGGQGIRARKLRTFLSMVSLFLGVLAIVGVQAGAQVADRAMRMDYEQSMGKDGSIQLYFPQGEKVPGIVLDTVTGQPGITAMVSSNAVMGETGLRPVNPNGASFDQQGSSYGGNYECNASGCFEVEDPTADLPTGATVAFSVTALTADLRQFRPLTLVSGDWLGFEGDPLMSPALVVNEALAKGLAMHRIPAELKFQGADKSTTPRIIGVVADGSSMPAAYTRIDEMALWVDPAALMVNNAQMWPSADDVKRVLESRIAASGADMRDWNEHVVNANDSIGRQLQMMRLIFLGMAILVLLIGVAGILNVGLATVGERVEEFALRRAVGTPRALLAGIVLAETMLIGLLTSGAAIAAGVVAVEVGSQVFGANRPMLADVVFPWEAGVAGVAAGLIAGLLGGLFPAIRAARIPIATVMRA